MAIKGLTDRETLKPRLPRLGKLRKGGEQKQHKTKKDKYGKPVMIYGDDLDHFRFTSDNPEVEAAFYAAYNRQPRIINVVMFYETTEENFETWIEAWDASGMIFRSDGENWHIWRDGSQYHKGTKPHTDHADQFEVGRLEVVIPELLEAGFVGTVTLETHSNHDLRNITSVLYAAEAERNSLRGAQFILRRVEEEISVPGWGERADQRSKARKWLVKLEAPTRMFNGLIDAPQQQQIEASTGEVIEQPRQLPRTTETKPAYNATPSAPAANGKPQPEQRGKLTYAQLKEKFNAFCGAMAERGFYIDAESGDKLPAKMHKAGEKTPQIIAATATRLLGDDKDAYHAALYNLTGKSSANDLTAIEAAGIFKILFNGAEEITFKTEPTETAAGDLKVIAEQDDLPF